MSETEYDPDWWKAAKALSLGHKEAAELAAAEALAGDSFLIVTEGVVTEPEYFIQLRVSLRLAAVKVVVEPGDASDARHVIETAARLAQRQLKRAAKGRLGVDEPAAFDQVWAVLDTDVSQRHRRWPDIVQLAEQRNVRLAYSTPCFEFWLRLHIRETAEPLLNGDTAKAILRKEIGEYSTNQEVAQSAIAGLLPNWPDAVLRAPAYSETA